MSEVAGPKEAAGARWRRSTYSGTGGGQCVEVTERHAGVWVRDSRVPEGAVLSFPADAWAAFIEAAVREDL
ncbi:DUF397 domain-containing protein [Streptomonospora sp. S1-112]|uniref:DUF397 domain-containing protein n=1 Tax=Streptomonospora mangrovi TaxID=2883123 RepID=A0A9X3NRT1_9ACTN|nr:DUF397 domain-containing protein [Streptomonospora mangrovi]MDA0562926.1 DUF397 domain-containing protein [Streptomonospora mangrovi]